MASPNDKSSADKPPASKPSAGKPPADRGRRKKRRKLVFAAAGFVVVLAIVGAWQAWLIFKPMMQQAAQTSGQASAAVSLRNVESRLNTVERRLEEVAAERAVVTFIESHELWWLGETERYLVEAGERLQTGADVKLALSALKAARRTLKGVKMAGADAAGRALDVEIRLLDGYRNEEAEQAIGTIDEMLRRLDAPPEVKPQAAAQVAASGEERGWWSRLTGAVGDRFEQLVVVEENAGAARRFNRGLAAHSLALARTAALAGDAVSYRHAVANAMELFEQESEQGAPMVAELQVLYALDVAGAPPRIGAALDKVRALAAELAP